MLNQKGHMPAKTAGFEVFLLRLNATRLWRKVMSLVQAS